MKILCITLLSILFAASITMAGFTLKSGVYRMNQLDAAESKALSGRKAVAFLYSDEKSFCIQCGESSRQAMETLAGSCVIVYVDKSDAAKLPKEVAYALRSSQAGKYIPVVVVMSYDLKNAIAIVPYARGEAYGKLLSEAKERILSFKK
jgi:thiamine pyrophosphate-dependent acetolactate synthase large subunit-like protein